MHENFIDWPLVHPHINDLFNVGFLKNIFFLHNTLLQEALQLINLAYSDAVKQT